MRWLRRPVTLVVLAALLVALWFVCRTVYLVTEAECDYLSTLFVLRLVEDYVTEHGAWPKSWNDLEQVKRSEPWDWPANSQDMQRRIAVDFNVTVNELARQSVDQFRAIQPVQPNELFNDSEVRQ